METSLLELIKTATGEVFGTDNYEFINGHITIKIPNAVVRNERGKTHPITDLYVRIGYKIRTRVSERFQLYGSLCGARGQMTADEYLAGYAHSHLDNIKGLTPFCLGSSPLNSAIAELKMDGVRKDDLDPYYAFLFMVEQLANSESIAGVPYIRFDNVGKKGFKSGHSIMTNAEYRESLARFRDLLRDHPMDLPSLDLSIDMQARKVTIQNPDALEHLFKECTIHRQTRTSDGVYYSIRSGNKMATYSRVKEYPNFDGFKFKGETIRLHVIIPKIEAPPEKEGEVLYAHQSVRNHIIDTIKKELEHKLTNFLYRYEKARHEDAVRKSYSEEERDTSNYIGSIFKDFTPVLSD
jgi:hypothetical protein